MSDQNLCTPAWLLIGMTGSAPGVLELVDGKIGFTSSEGRVFEALFSDIAVKYPWYYFGGGCKISVGQQVYRISFVKPNGAADLPGNLLSRTSGGGGARLAYRRPQAARYWPGPQGGQSLENGTGRTQVRPVRGRLRSPSLAYGTRIISSKPQAGLSKVLVPMMMSWPSIQ